MFGFVKKTELEAEIKKNETLSKKLKEKADFILIIQRDLEENEIRFRELTTSEQYKRSQDFDRLMFELSELKRQVRDEARYVQEFKDQALKKAQSEIDEYVKKVRHEEEKKTDDIKSELSGKISRLSDDFEKTKAVTLLIYKLKDVAIKKSKSEIYEYVEKVRQEECKKIDSIKRSYEKAEGDLLKKTQEILAITDEIKAKKQELKEIESNIEISDELSTVTHVTQMAAGINSLEIKRKIDENKDKQRDLIKCRKAWTAYNHYYLNDSLTAGKAQQSRLGKFLLTAFNAQSDNIISLAKKGSFHSCHTQIEKWFEKINKLGEDHQIVMERQYLKLRLEELKIVVGYHLQKEFEKEEERYINESIREEKRVQKEIESFVKSREKEEKIYKDEIERVTKELKASSESEVDKLKDLINDLQLKLERSVKEKERAMSLAQLTRSGHVYIISNEGSFGQGVYKIGMTRRLDPMDRVKELGDASVPFFFDVHGIIHSDDAPGLERELHKRFEACRVNKENYRREFFRVPIEEIENAICEIHGQISLDRLSRNEDTKEEVFQDED